MGPGGGRHGLRDRAHAADGVPPQPLPAVHFAERMMQHDVGRARRVRAGIVADDGVEAEQRLDQVAFKDVVEHVTGGPREQVEQGALALQRQPAQDIGAGQRVERFTHGVQAKPFDHVRRRTQHEIAQHIGDGFQFAVEIVDPQGIAFAEFCDRLMRPAVTGQQVTAIRCGQEVLRAALHDPQAVVMQAEIRDHLRIEQAHRVGGYRIAEPRMKLLGHSRAADHLAAINHLYPQATHCEVGRAGQAVMASADNKCIVIRHGPVIIAGSVTRE